MVEIDVQHVAKLAKLSIEEEKVGRFTEEMQGILNMVENLPPITGAGALLDPENVMELRADEVVPSFPREQILKNAPKTAEGCFAVPKTVE